MDNEKLFEFMTKMYSKMEEEFKKSDERFNKIDNRLMVIENDHGSKLDALLDGYKQLAEGQKEIRADIRKLELKQQNQEVEIRVLKGIAK